MVDGLCSIIIPTYKGSQSVQLAIKSALRQEKIQKEVIVVDDNGLGTEEQRNTEIALQQYIKKKQIIYICHKKNRNGSAARNTGLKNAKGIYISFLDDDDYLLPEKTYKQVELLMRNPDCAMCVCSACYVDTNGIGYKIVLRHENDLLYKYLLDKMYFNTSAIMFRKEYLESVEGFDESFRRHQDWELVTRILSKYNCCVLEDVEMIRYLEQRNNPQSFEQMKEHLEHFLEKCELHMRERLSTEQIQKVKTYRRREICQKMIRKGKFIEAYKYGKTYGGKSEVLKAGGLFIPLLTRKIVHGSKKVAPSRAEIDNEHKTKC